MTTQNASYPYMPFEASGDLSGAQYRIMAKNSSPRQVFRANSDDDTIVGVLQNQPAAEGRAATVCIGGTAKVVAGAAIAAGDRVTTDSQGRAIKSVYGNGDLVSQLGVAITAVTAAGQFVEVLVQPVIAHQGASQA